MTRAEIMIEVPPHLSWENFRASVCVNGERRVHRVSISPLVEIYSDGTSQRIGLWAETAAGTVVPEEILRLASISIKVFQRGGRTLLDVSGASPALHRQFYYFALAVSGRILGESRSAVDAVELELGCFEDLLGEKPLLGIERQIGLLGELLVLERLIRRSGSAMVGAWNGPWREPHDFRIGPREFEVKSTVDPHRIHTIHGVEQLVPSAGCSLYLVSVMLGPLGAEEGFSLADKAAEVAALVSRAAEHRDRFAAGLEACGFQIPDQIHYRRKFALRRPLAIAQVDKRFPAVTRPGIEKLLGARASRIESIQYEVNIEGIAVEEGHRTFPQVLSL